MDDCNILGTPEVLNEVVQQLPALVMSEACPTSQAPKKDKKKEIPYKKGL